MLLRSIAPLSYQQQNEWLCNIASLSLSHMVKKIMTLLKMEDTYKCQIISKNILYDHLKIF